VACGCVKVTMPGVLQGLADRRCLIMTPKLEPWRPIVGILFSESQDSDDVLMMLGFLRNGTAR
jgi:hypothetical protein